MKKGILLSIAAILLLLSFCNGQTRAKLTGYITDCQSGEPLQGVAVSADENEPVYTDVYGYYSLALVSGVYDITMQKENYATIELPDYNFLGLMTLDTCTSMPFQPELSPEEIWTTLYNWCLIGTEYATITNNGTAGFSWYAEIIEVTDDSKEECDWLTLNESSGFVEPGYCFDVELIFDFSNYTHFLWTPKAVVYFHFGEEDLIKEIFCCVEFVITGGFDQYRNTSKILVTPNPCTSFITLKRDHKNRASFTVSNTNGVAIIEGTLLPNENTINVEALPPGIYILKLEDEKHQVSVGKFVKQ